MKCKYIDADLLRNEIERRRKAQLDKNGNAKNLFCAVRLWAYADLLGILDSLNQEQPESPFLIEKAIVWFNNIAENAKKLSTGNVSHLAPTIAGMAIRSAEFLEKRKQEQPAVDLEKAARHVYESWMGGTMEEVRRDMVTLGTVLNARKEDEKP